MKKFITFLFCAVVMCTFIQSCNSKVDQASQAALVTIKKSTGPAGFMGLLDNGDRLYVSNLRKSYNPNDGQRAIIYFNEIEPKVEGFTYNADVYGVDDILTKNLVVLNDVAKDTLGTNKISITRAWVGGGFMNIEFKVLIDNFNAKNYFNLVDNRLVNPGNEDGELTSAYPLEFRYKTDWNNDGAGQLVSGIACFNLGFLNPVFSDNKSFTITYNSIYSGQKTITVNLDKETVVSDL